MCYQETCSSFTPLGPSLDEKLYSSCDFTADKTAQFSFKSKSILAEMGPGTKVSTQFNSSTKARNWAAAPEDLGSIFIAEKLPEVSVSAPSVPPSTVYSSPQTSSDSGERRACLLVFLASSLACFAAHNHGSTFPSLLGKYFHSF